MNKQRLYAWLFLVLLLLSLLPFTSPPVDSATETYEITDDGAIKHLDVFPGDINNWEAVNDVDTANYVYWYSTTYDYDTYTMENHGIELGPINSVTIDARCLQAESPGAGDARIACRTHSTVYYDASFAVDNPPGLAVDDWVMAVNPNTGVAWTWDEVDAMEPGISLKGDTVNDKTQCFYITVEVDYDAELDPQTNDATLVEETTCMLNGVAYGDNGMTVGFWYNTSTTTPLDFGNNVTVPGVKGDSEPFNYEPLGLTSGDLYYVRAWALKAGVGFFNDTTEKNFMTKPTPPTNLNYTHYPTNITVNWTNVSRNDDVLQYTHIRWKVGSYPSSRTDGSLLYNGSNESAPLLNWQPETHYYFRSWTYVSEGGLWRFSDTTGDLDFISDDYANNLSVSWINDTAVYLEWDKGINNTVLIVNDTAVPERPVNGTEIYNGSAEYYLHGGLTPSTRYYYGVWTINNGVGFSDGYSTNDTYTEPTRPSNLNYLIQSGATFINISWTVGTGATHTLVQRSATSQPLVYSDGTGLYNGTLTWYNMSGLDRPYYFSLFSYNSTTKLYSNGSNLSWYVIWFNVYNEINHSNISNFDVFISNQEGTDTFLNESCVAPLLINISDIPQGDNIIITVSREGYRTRSYIRDIYITGNYILNIYLIPIDIEGEGEDCQLLLFEDSMYISNPGVDAEIELTHELIEINSVQIYNTTLYGTYGGWLTVPNTNFTYNTTHVVIDNDFLDANSLMGKATYYYEYCGLVKSLLCEITVIDELENTISNVNYLIQRFNNVTETYITVGTGLTDGYGQFTVWLEPLVSYRFDFSLAGYHQTGSHFWTPSTLKYTKTFQLEFNTTDFMNASHWWETITFDCTRNTTTHRAAMYFNDPSGGVVNVSFSLMERNFTSEVYTLIWLNTTTNSVYWMNRTGLDVQAAYSFTMHLNHTIFGYVVHSVTLFPGDWGTGGNRSIVDSTTIDTLWDSVLGSHPWGWTNFIAVFVLIACLFSFGPHGAGLSLIGTGFTFIFLNIIIGIVSITVTIPILFIVFGLLVEWKNRQRVGG